MHHSTPVFPSVPVTFSGQSLISHAGVTVLTGFMDALGFGRLCDDRSHAATMPTRPRSNRPRTGPTSDLSA